MSAINITDITAKKTSKSILDTFDPTHPANDNIRTKIHAEWLMNNLSLRDICMEAHNAKASGDTIRLAAASRACNLIIDHANNRQVTLMGVQWLREGGRKWVKGDSLVLHVTSTAVEGETTSLFVGEQGEVLVRTFTQQGEMWEVHGGGGQVLAAIAGAMYLSDDEWADID